MAGRKEAVEETLAAEVFRPENMSCPHAIWRKMRDECPVPKIHFPHTGQDAFLITRKADIEYVASHPEEFTAEVEPTVWRWGSDFGPDFADIFADGGYTPVHTIVSSDPPRALKYRKIVLEALSSARIAARRENLQAIIDRLIAKLPPDGTVFDFREAFAVPLPLLAIMDVFGLPERDFDFIYRFTCDFLNLVDPTTPIPVARENARWLVAAQKYLAPLIEGYRKVPAGNFLSSIANARDDKDELLTMEQALSVAFISLIGGNETSRNAIATAAFHLARDKAMWQALKADPSKIPAFSEEIVRLGSPATATARQVARDTELSGTQMPKGSPVLVMWGSGSHDERAFDRPDVVDLDRPSGRQHTSFGFGVHHCAGIHLARAEMNLGIESLLRAFESFDLAVPESDIHYSPVFAIRALESLPVTARRAHKAG